MNERMLMKSDSADAAFFHSFQVGVPSPRMAAYREFENDESSEYETASSGEDDDVDAYAGEFLFS